MRRGSELKTRESIGDDPQAKAAEMMKQIALMADEQDAQLLLRMVSAAKNAIFVRAGLFDSAELHPVGALELSDIGFARSGDINHEPTYLVAEAVSQFQVRPVPQRNGGVKYAIDQNLNPDTVVLTLGGRYSDNVVVAGRMGTVSSTKDSLDLYKLFERIIKKTFTRVRAYYVGPQAMEALRRGERLTASVRSPELYDLSPESPS